VRQRARVCRAPPRSRPPRSREGARPPAAAGSCPCSNAARPRPRRASGGAALAEPARVRKARCARADAGGPRVGPCSERGPPTPRRGPFFLLCDPVPVILWAGCASTVGAAPADAAQNRFFLHCCLGAGGHPRSSHRNVGHNMVSFLQQRPVPGVRLGLKCRSPHPRLAAGTATHALKRLGGRAGLAGEGVLAAERGPWGHHDCRDVQLRGWACSAGRRKLARSGLWGLDPACMCGGLGAAGRAHSAALRGLALHGLCATGPCASGFGLPSLSRGAFVR